MSTSTILIETRTPENDKWKFQNTSTCRLLKSKWYSNTSNYNIGLSTGELFKTRFSHKKNQPPQAQAKVAVSLIYGS